MKCRRFILVVSLAIVRIGVSPCDVATGAGGNPPTVVSNCIEADLRAAVSQGGTIRFDCDGIIKLSTNLVVTQSMIIDGTGHNITISGSGDTRVFWIEGRGVPPTYLTLRNLVIADGYSQDGAGVYNRSGGLTTIESCIFSNNVAVGGVGSTGVAGAAGTNGGPGGNGEDGGAGQKARGGAIYHPYGQLIISNSIFIGNSARAGKGGAAGAGGTGGSIVDQFGRCVAGSAGGNGGAGGTGGDALGGAIYSEGLLQLSECLFSSNRVVAGSGGNGGGQGIGGCLSPGSVAGVGGVGGSAHGGAIFSGGVIYGCKAAFVYNSSTGGGGGAGGQAWLSVHASPGAGGNGGAARGGALASSYTNLWFNVTWGHNFAAGGEAGVGGFVFSPACPTHSANGGTAWGGAIDHYSGYDFNAQFCTIWNNAAYGGSATNPCDPAFNGTNGLTIGAGIFITTNGGAFIHDSIIGGSNCCNCAGNMESVYALTPDPTCFRDPWQRPQDPKLGPLANNGGLSPTFALLPGSPAIDGAFEQAGWACVATDQRGVSRDFGYGFDIGAFEWRPDRYYISSIRGYLNEFELVGYGVPGATFQLEATTTFDTWTTTQTGRVSDRGIFRLLEDNVALPPKRSYRIKSP